MRHEKLFNLHLLNLFLLLHFEDFARPMPRQLHKREFATLLLPSQ